MVGFALSLVLMAEPAGKTATALASTQAWDQLYLTFASVDPRKVPAKDARSIASALARGCEALLSTDAVLAFSLGEKSVAFSSQPSSVACASRAALQTEQRGAAEQLLRTGLARHQADPKLSALLGRMLLDDGDASGAHALIARVRSKSPELKTLAAEVGVALQVIADVPVDRPPSTSFASSTDEEGRRLRENTSFRFRYFSGQRDFGQRAEYEGRVQAALELARATSQRVLGVSRVQIVDVVLYSKAEFTLHHGPWAASAIAGFYSGNAIRMNDSAEIGERTEATLVHEYVHAIVDELAGFEASRVPRWLNEGLAEHVEWEFVGRERAEGRYALLLRQLAAQRRLPSLGSMRDDPLIAATDPGLLYSYSALAVRSLVRRFGMPAVLSLLRARAVDFDRSFAQHTGIELAQFEADVRDELTSR